jgi:hypothetical protein
MALIAVDFGRLELTAPAGTTDRLEKRRNLP